MDYRSVKGDEDLGQLVKLKKLIKNEILEVLTHKGNPNLTHVFLI